MPVLVALALLGGGALLLIKGADWFMDGVGDTAKALGLSVLAIGILLAGLEPEEMLTAAIASAQGYPALALGNIIGTNVTMVTAALGISALIAPMTLDRRLRRPAILATIVSLLPIGLLLSGAVSRLAGLLLLIVFIGYTFLLIRTDRATLERKEMLERDDDDDDEQPETRSTLWRDGAMVVAGVVAMAVGGPAIVGGAEGLTRSIGLNQHAVGATLVSLATGSEMIVLGIVAARKQRAEVLLGGLLGSFAYNLLVTLGLAAAIRPIPVDLQQTAISFSCMIVAHLLLLFAIWRGRLGRLAGIVFLLFYAGYVLAMVLTGFSPR